MTANIIDPQGEAIEVGPGRGNMRQAAVPAAQWFSGGGRAGTELIGGRTVSHARLVADQPYVGAAVMRMLTWAVRVPLKIYRRIDDDNRQRLGVSEHPLALAIRDPWEGASQAQLIQALLGGVLVHGNSVSGVEEGAGGKLRFDDLDWRSLVPVKASARRIAGWQVREDGEERELSADHAVHVAWWSPLGPVGISPLRQLGTTVRVEDAAQRYQQAIFRNSARPPSAITLSESYSSMDGEVRDAIMETLRADIDAVYANPENGGRPALMPPGAEWKAVGHTAVEADLIKQRNVAREEVCAVYQIPPPMLGILDKATYCLPGDALVMTERGSRPIAEIEAGDRVWSMRDDRLALSVVGESRCTGVKPLLTVRTANRAVRCTDNHPVLTARRCKGERSKRRASWRHEWVPAGDLAVGDLIVTAQGLPEHGGRECPTRHEVSAGFMEFCGLLLGDGKRMLRQVRELFIGLGVPVSNVRAQRSWVTLPDGRRMFSVMWTFKAADPEANASVVGSNDPQDSERMRTGRRWARKAYAYVDRNAGTPPNIEGCGLARVRSIERGEVSVPVYDLTVPDAHNFVAEGVVVHNSNITTQREMAYTDSLGPPLVLIEQAINAQLIRHLLREDDVYVEFDFAGVLRGDRLKEVQALREAITTGLMTRNEGRGVLNMPRSSQDGMDEFYFEANNMGRVGTSEADQEDAS